MAWVKLDDRFWSNRKVRRAGESGMMYVLALSWSADELTDGVIPMDELPFICSGLALDLDVHAERLVDVGLFVIDGDCYVIPDFLEFNDSADVIRERRAKDRERKAKGGRKGSVRTPEPDQQDSGRIPGGVPTESGSPDPTRPDPTKGGAPQAAATTTTTGSKRGTRLDPGWIPPAEAASMMADEYPTVDLELETAKFVDFWIAKPGRDGCKLDWTATWRNWIRRAAGDGPGARSAPALAPRGDIGPVPFVPPAFQGHNVPDKPAPPPTDLRKRLDRQIARQQERATA